VSPDCQALGLDRLQLGALAALAGGSGPMDAALITLLGLCALQVSEACSVELDDFGTTHGRRNPAHHRQGRQTRLIPLPPPVTRTLDQAAADRACGPLLLTRTRRRMDRYAASRIVHRLAKQAGMDHKIGCDSLRHSYITAALDAGVPCATYRSPPATPTPAPPATTEPAATSTGTPTTGRLHRRKRLIPEHKNRHKVRSSSGGKGLQLAEWGGAGATVDLVRESAATG
jgi:Phage integrase family